MIITIDGPSSSGKSTAAKLLSKFYSIVHIDSGSIYRAITLLALDNNLITDKKINIRSLIKCLGNNKISFERNKRNKFQICINNKYVEKRIRTSKISNNVSTVATIKEIREYVLKLQRKIAKNQSIVMDGRDIGSVVFKRAYLKLYIDVDVNIRAKRRYKQLIDNGEKSIYLKILKDIKLRDKTDKTRKNSPLVVPKGAMIINNSHAFRKTIQEFQ